jgi:ABC-type transport system involved in multi-copper enzyme maturation permease subunit
VRQFLAVMADSLREARARKELWLVLLLASLPILLCASISFRREPMEKTLESLAGKINRLPRGPGRRGGGPRLDLHVAIKGIEPAGRGEEWPPEIRGGHVLDLAFTEPGQLAQLVDRFRDLVLGGGRAAPPAAPETRPPPTETEKDDFLKERFTTFGFNRVCVRPHPAGGERYLVGVRSDYVHEIRGAHSFSLLFGLFPEIPLLNVSVAEFTLRLERGLFEVFAGIVVMAVALLATSGFVPNLLQKGTLDLVLARPIGRTRLLLYKYAGGLWFVAVFTTYLILGAWLALGLRIGYWNPWFLLSIGTVIATFAVLYSVSVLAGVVTRSAGLAGMIALGVWGLSGLIVNLHQQLRLMLYGAELPQWLLSTLDVSYTVLPKTTHLALLSTYALSHSYLSPGMYTRTFGRELEHVDWTFSLGTTAAFTAVMLALAVWRFRRTDY